MMQAKDNYNDLVSVIMTAYNAELTIERSIKSFKKQTHNNSELIIIDDASTDNTLNIAKSYASNKIRVFHTDINSGLFFCKNYGITKSKGRYITSLDSDDWIDENHIENLLRIYGELSNSDNYLGRDSRATVKIVGVPSKVRWMDKILSQSTSLAPKKMLSGIYKNLLVEPICMATCFFEKSIIDDIGYFDCSRFSADKEFHRRACHVYGIQPYLMPKSFASYNYVRRADSLTMKKETSIDSDPRNFYEKAFDDWHEKCRTISAKPFMPFPVNQGVRDRKRFAGGLNSFLQRPFSIDKFEDVILSGNTCITSFSEIKNEET